MQLRLVVEPWWRKVITRRISTYPNFIIRAILKSVVLLCQLQNSLLQLPILAISLLQLITDPGQLGFQVHPRVVPGLALAFCLCRGVTEFGFQLKLHFLQTRNLICVVFVQYTQHSNTVMD